MSRFYAFSELTAFDVREAFSECVHADNVDAGRKQLTVYFLQFGKTQVAMFKKRGSAAGDQKNEAVICRQSVGKFESFPCRFERVFIGDRVPRLVRGNVFQFTLNVTVFGDDDTFDDTVTYNFGGSFRHTEGRLSDREQIERFAVVGKRCQSSSDSTLRFGAFQRSIDDAVCVEMQLL